MIGGISRTRHRRDRGFTLIELLVVIVILGILSGVVVFAVRGTGDKGRQAADDVDLRTLRTAQEAYCARFGFYAENEGQLVNPSTDPRLAGRSPGTKGFLSDESETHDIAPPDPDQPKPCGGTGYKITGGEDPADPLPPGTGSFIDVPDPPFPVRALVPLDKGRVLAWGYNPATQMTDFAQFNPASPGWIAGDSMRGSTPGYSLSPGAYAVLLDDPLTPLSECAPNCGKMLTKAALDFRWWLYNPDAPRGAQWEPAGTAPYSDSSYGSNPPVQLMDDRDTPGSQCGLNCGKVLVTTRQGNHFTQATPVGELYDPRTNSFAPFAYPSGQENAISNAATLALLRDGRVLLTAESQGGVTQLLTTENLTFSDAPNPPVPYTSFSPPVLSNGDVLFGGSGKSKGIYRPKRGEQGAWLPAGTVPNCGGTGDYCMTLASLADGTVFAHSRTDSGGGNLGPSTGKTFLLEAGAGAWSWRGAADVKPTSAVCGCPPPPPLRSCGMWLPLRQGAGRGHDGAALPAAWVIGAQAG